MNRASTFKMVAISAILLAIFAIPLVGVKGEPSTTVSGIWYPNVATIVLSNIKYTGANVHFDGFMTGGFWPGGPITGTFSQTLHYCLHYGDPEIVATIPPIEQISKWPEAKSFEFTQSVRFVTGTVLGKSGAFEMLLECKGHGQPVIDRSSTF